MTIEILISEAQHTLLRCPHYHLIPWFDAPPPPITHSPTLPHLLPHPGSVHPPPPLIHLPSLIPYLTLVRCTPPPPPTHSPPLPHPHTVPWFGAPLPHPLRYPDSVPLLPPIHPLSLIPCLTLVGCPWWIVIWTIRVGSILRYNGDVILILIFSIKRIQGRDNPCSIVDLELAVVRTNVLDGITYLQKEITLKCKDALQ